MYLNVETLKLIDTNSIITYPSYLPLEIEFNNEMLDVESSMYCLSISWDKSMLEIFINKESKMLQSVFVKMLGDVIYSKIDLPSSAENIFLTPIINTSLLWDELLEDDYFIRLEQKITTIYSNNILQIKWDDTNKSFNINRDLGVTLNKKNEISSIILYNYKKGNINSMSSFV